MIAPGYFADMVLLDLKAYNSKANFAAANRVPTGIKAVYVNGKLAYSPNSKAKTFRAGKVLRIK